MRTIELVLAIHNHQPPGNFEHVIEDAHERAYAPFLAVLDEHPAVRCVLHQPGTLWDWMDRRHPETVARVRRLVERGQVEILGGGHAEPLLAVLPERDRQGQLRRMRDDVRRRFGVEPQGAWLAERVWEPQLAASLARAGYGYTVLDDAHFEAAGVDRSAVHGAWITEDEGLPLRVFGIRRELRQAIPFAPPEEVLGLLHRLAAESAMNGPCVLVYGDDGEKFGVWGGTRAACYGPEAWLDRFFRALTAEPDVVTTTTFASALTRHGLRGRAYLPAAAYDELDAWALPPPAQRALAEARTALAESPPRAQARLRGGHWRHFFVRYPESRWRHQRMLEVSARLDAWLSAAGKRRGPSDGRPGDPSTVSDGGADFAAAREALWRAQCCCASWHGLFGGIYLPHLRQAAWRDLLSAERWADAVLPRPAAEVRDFDADGSPEVLLRSDALQAFIDPAAGGTLLELDARAWDANLVDLFRRRDEVYLAGPERPGGETRLGAESGTCIEAFLPPDFDLPAFVGGPMPALSLSQPTGATPPVAWTLDGGVLQIDRVVALPGGGTLWIRKAMRVEAAALVVRYVLRWVDAPVAPIATPGDAALPPSPAESPVFAVELGINLLAGDAPDRFFAVPGRSLDDASLGSTGRLGGVERIDLVDASQSLRVIVEAEPAADVWRAPLVTVSQSDHGLESVYQGSRLLFRWSLLAADGSEAVRVLRLTATEAPA